MASFAKVLFPALALLGATASVSAGTLRVIVYAPGAVDGEIGCALYASADGFPMDAGKARAQLWQPASSRLECLFEDLPEGSYAVALSHDRNGNRIVDTNFLGMPKEGWGVSRNARPSLRPPRFDEAAVSVPAQATVVIDVEVRK